jgi:sensor domain CHASE-containing protein
MRTTNTLFSKVVANHYVFFVLLITATVTACSKNAAVEIEQPAVASTAAKTNMLLPATLLHNNASFNAITLWELQQARAATARYRDTLNAVKDGYTNINVIVENMGTHFMKMAHVDDVFDYRKPEILVYNKMEDGSMQLVAVEYAVPISLSPDKAPEGFTGSNDVWDKNTGFGLWLLHAWVWYPNPLGVFHATNSDIHLHD